ncbi:MAG: HmuY family protein, partial [Oceanococcaceae bacterium]
ETPDSEPVTPNLPGPGGLKAEFREAAAGHFEAVIDASDEQSWVYLDLDSQTQVTPGDPEADDSWDIAFSRVNIKLNGGSSGAPPTGLPVIVHADKVTDDSDYPWESVTGAPPVSAVPYHQDMRDGDEVRYAMTTFPEADGRISPVDGAGDYGWYEYSGHFSGARITPRRNVAYIVRTVECRYISLRMTGYYNDADASGYPQFDLREVPGPACGGDSEGGSKATFTPTVDGQRVDVDATDEAAWVYLDLGNAMDVPVPVNPADDATWDIAFKRTDIKVNGGTSGSGRVALHDIAAGDWSEITALADGAELHTDTTDALAFVTFPEPVRTGDSRCGNINSDNGWYYYSGFCNDGDGIHAITPRDVVYVLRDRLGNAFKLRMLGYYNAVGESAHPSFEFAPVEARP